MITLPSPCPDLPPTLPLNKFQYIPILLFSLPACMALRRNQLKKITLEQIMGILQQEKDSDNIKLITSFINDKNETLLDKRNYLLHQIEETRRKIDKSVHGLNGRVKDRLDKKSLVVMNKDSRPSNQNVTELMELYAYIEDQCAIIDRNHEEIQHLTSTTKDQCQSLEEVKGRTQNYQDLDNQYASLNERCAAEEVVRDALLKERNEKRAHYANIHGSIEQCRKEYEVVETKIREKQRQLIQLATYYQSRQNQDSLELLKLPLQTIDFESQLLQAQSRLNQCERVLQDRVLKTVEAREGAS